jgi:hypothetical protein
LKQSRFKAALASLVCALSSVTQAGDSDFGWKAAVAVTTFAVVLSNPAKAGSIGAGYLTGEENIPSVKLMARWPIKEVLNESWVLGELNLHLGYGRWQHPDDSSQAGVNNVLEFIPIFRFRHPSWTKVYVETAIGLSVFSRAEFGNQRFGTNFQFSDSLAIGAVWGMNNKWDISLQYQHYSNNGNTAINDGMDFFGINVFYKY